MLKQTITYIDFEDREITEDFYFNFTLLELIEQIEVKGLEKRMHTLTQTQDGPGAYKIFKEIVLDAHGKRSEDGRSFLKTPEIRAEFEGSAAISEMIIEFLQDESLGVAFIGGLLPREKMDVAIARAQARRSTAGVHGAPSAPVAPAQNPNMPERVQTDETAASETRITPVPQTGALSDMTTSEKRMYSTEELRFLGDQDPNMPTRVYTDEDVLAMDPQELSRLGLLERAYRLKA